MPKLEIHVTRKGRVVLGHLEKPRGWWSKAQRKVLQSAGEIIAEDARKSAPRDTGRGARSIRPVVRGARMEIDMLPHMVVMHKGRRPGSRMPPLDPIRGWLFRKQTRGQLVGANAFLIARSIGRKGIKKHNFLRNAVRKLRRNTRLQDEYKRAVEREIRGE